MNNWNEASIGTVIVGLVCILILFLFLLHFYLERKDREKMRKLEREYEETFRAVAEQEHEKRLSKQRGRLKTVSCYPPPYATTIVNLDSVKKRVRVTKKRQKKG